MGGSRKSKRVTWASDEYLCQVNLSLKIVNFLVYVEFFLSDIFFKSNFCFIGINRFSERF